MTVLKGSASTSLSRNVGKPVSVSDIIVPSGLSRGLSRGLKVTRCQSSSDLSLGRKMRESNPDNIFTNSSIATRVTKRRRALKDSDVSSPLRTDFSRPVGLHFEQTCIDCESVKQLLKQPAIRSVFDLVPGVIHAPRHSSVLTLMSLFGNVEREDVFVDWGCGFGTLLYYGLATGFGRCIGIDLPEVVSNIGLQHGYALMREGLGLHKNDQRIALSAQDITEETNLTGTHWACLIENTKTTLAVLERFARDYNSVACITIQSAGLKTAGSALGLQSQLEPSALRLSKSSTTRSLLVWRKEERSHLSL